MKRIVLAMSGGVDSSVAALLLKEQGYDVVGIFLRTGVAETVRADARHRGCCSAVDAKDARLVADRLGIPCYALDFADQFRQVMDYFADEYVRGHTPNPCVVCNSQIKFGRLWELAQSLDADYLATGHYAQLANEGGKPTLRRAHDTQKDQSYVLFGIPRALLDRLVFPIGHLTKAQVREHARRAGLLAVAEKPESQDICFVPDGNAAGFIRAARPEAFVSGEVVDTQGNVLGHHPGIAGFTVGQRKGLGIDRSKLQGRPRFVLDIVPDQAKVIVGTQEECLTSAVSVQKCNWFLTIAGQQNCLIKWSHNTQPVAGQVRVMPEDHAEVQFAQPQMGIAPGQAIVFYRDDLVLGGGWVAK